MVIVDIDEKKLIKNNLRIVFGVFSWCNVEHTIIKINQGYYNAQIHIFDTKIYLC